MATIDRFVGNHGDDAADDIVAGSRAPRPEGVRAGAGRSRRARTPSVLAAAVTETTRRRDTSGADPKRWWALLILSLALLVTTVGNGAVNIVIPVLAGELGADAQDLQWVAAAYGLALAGLLFTGGAVGDRFGRKGAFLAGLLLFLTASVLAAWSGELPVLTASRALMGVSAAFLLPSSLAILVDVFPLGERARAIGIWTSFLGVSGAVAPVAAGLVLTHFDYRAVFLLSAPFVVIAVVGGLFMLRTSSDPERTPVDRLGGLLSTAGIAAIVLALVEAPHTGWSSPVTLGAASLGVLVLVTFVWWERRCAHPMIDLRLFRNGAFVVGLLGTMFLFLAIQAVMFLTTQHLQIVAGHSPLVAGLVNIPWGLLVFLASLSSHRVAARLGENRTVALGALLVAASCVALAALIGPDQSLGAFTVLMCFFHLGFGLGMAPLTVAVVSAVPERRAGGGGALNSFARELGGALGVAVGGSVAASVYSWYLTSSDHVVSESIRERLLSSVGAAVRALDDVESETARDTMASAVDTAFDLGFAAALLLVAVGALALAVAAMRRLSMR